MTMPVPESISPLFAQDAEPVDQSQLYWGARDGEEVVKQLDAKERAYFEFATLRGFVDMWKVAHAQVHGLDPEAMNSWATQSVGFDGDVNELLRFRINEVRSFMRQQVTMSIGQRPSFECDATNDDYDSLGQAEGGDAIIEYVYNDKLGERKERRCVFSGDMNGISWMWLNWDPSAGTDVQKREPIMRTLPDGTKQPALDAQGQPAVTVSTHKTGDIRLAALGPWDVFYEPQVEDFDDHLWRCVRTKRSKWELANLFPQHRDKLLAAGTRDEWSFNQLLGIEDVDPTSSTDEIVVKHFYHVPSPALGEKFKGRYIMYAAGVPLIDMNRLPYAEIPLVDYCPSEYFGTAFGYSDAWDMFSVNQMLDQVISDIATSLATFGRPTMWVEEGTDYSPDAIASGNRVLTGRTNTKPPVFVSPPVTPGASQWFIDLLRSFMQSLSGLNGVTRGDPQHNITSGQMAALFHSIAQEFNSGRQMAVDSLRERTANMMLNILKQYAEHPMIMKIAGKSERAYADSFTRDELSAIKGVRVKTSNPMMRTQAGRLQLAEIMMKVEGAVTTPEQVVEILVSGQIKPLYDGPRKRNLQVRWEDEALMRAGQPAGPTIEMITPPAPPPMPDGLQLPAPPPYQVVVGVPVHYLENHEDHINSHFTLMTARNVDPAVRETTQVHIEHHYKVWKEADPARLIALKLPPYPVAPPGMGPMPVRDPKPEGPSAAPERARDVAAPGAMPKLAQPPLPDPKAAHPQQRQQDLGVALPKPSQSPVPPPQG